MCEFKVQRCEILIGSIKTHAYIRNHVHAYAGEQQRVIKSSLPGVVYACGLSLQNLVVALLSSLTWSTSRTHYINGCVCIIPCAFLTHCSRTSRSTQSEEVSHPLSIPHTMKPCIQYETFWMLSRGPYCLILKINYLSAVGNNTMLGYDPSWLMTVLAVPYTPANNTNNCHAGWMLFRFTIVKLNIF